MTSPPPPTTRPSAPTTARSFLNVLPQSGQRVALSVAAGWSSFIVCPPDSSSAHAPSSPLRKRSWHRDGKSYDSTISPDSADTADSRLSASSRAPVVASLDDRRPLSSRSWYLLPSPGKLPPLGGRATLEGMGGSKYDDLVG